jgi:hypothetical protein
VDDVGGELDGLAGRSGSAQECDLRAVQLARSVASLLVGVAMVGLLAERARSGRTAEALAGYREVIDHFDRTGN